MYREDRQTSYRSPGFKQTNHYRDSSRDFSREFSRDFSQVIKAKVHQLPAHIKPSRAGVILTSTVGGVTWFGLGVHSESHDLTDFSGGVSYNRRRETAVQGALREFYEETLGIFGTIFVEDVGEYPVIYDTNMMIIFLHVAVDPELCSEVYLDQFNHVVHTTGNEPEICSIQWFKFSQLRDMLAGKEMYSKLRSFLTRAGDFSRVL